MTSAIATIANDGVFIPPRVVLGLRDVDGRLNRFDPPEHRRAVSSRTAAEVAVMLERVIINGTGSLARVPGYRLAGKSGTAQKIVNGTYSTTNTTVTVTSEGTYRWFVEYSGDANNNGIAMARMLIVEAQQAGSMRGGDPEAVLIAAQAMMYGLARMVVDGLFETQGISADRAIEMAELVTDQLGRGFRPPG